MRVDLNFMDHISGNNVGVTVVGGRQPVQVFAEEGVLAPEIFAAPVLVNDF